MSTLVVIAVAPADIVAASDQLRGVGAELLPSRSMGSNRVLVYGRFTDEEPAARGVTGLRKSGWAAVQRPADDDPSLPIWQARTRPVLVGRDRVRLCFPWSEFQRDEVPTIEVDPGGAFGGGSHPTTLLIVDALADGIHGGERVLDVGCGSGVLALAAVRLGAASAVGIDVEAAAVAATSANAARNGLSSQITALQTPIQQLDGTFDVVVANIGREVLIGMAGDLERLLASDGWLGLSGISPAQVSLLMASFRSVSILATPSLDDWSAVIAVKSGSA